MKNIPMSLFPLSIAKKLCWPFKGMGEFIQNAFPHYELTLAQAGIYATKDEYFAIALMNSFLYTLFLTVIFNVVLHLMSIQDSLLPAFGIALAIGFFIFIRIVLGLQLVINNNIKSIDSNLVFGLKMMLLEINAGVSLFDSMVMITTYPLGELSTVFKEISKRLNSGEQEEEVLKDIATKNPSNFLKKVLWQLVSGLKSGSSIGNIVSESLSALERQQKTDIVSYGSSLRIFTLVFMMLGVIIPAMGMTFLVVLNSLPGVHIGRELPWILLALVVVFEFMLIGFIKSKRPNLMGSV